MSDEIKQKEWELYETKSKYQDLDIKQNESLKYLEEEINNYKLKIVELERRESELASQYDKD